MPHGILHMITPTTGENSRNEMLMPMEGETRKRSVGTT